MGHFESAQAGIPMDSKRSGIQANEFGARTIRVRFESMGILSGHFAHGVKGVRECSINLSAPRNKFLMDTLNLSEPTFPRIQSVQGFKPMGSKPE